VPYLTLCFELRGLDPQRAERACLDLGALAISYSDSGDEPVLEPAPGEVRLWPRTRLQALFAGEANGQSLSETLARDLLMEEGRIETGLLADRAWEREWLRDFHALRFGRRLWVCPHHEQVPAGDAVVIRLDPGLAFGTGTHPTTALCLEWLDAQPIAGRHVIDYGSGSGILGIAAALLGATQVDAFDIDPQALLATAENATANGVGARLRVHQDAATLPPGTDLLIANILASSLCALVAEFARRLGEGGQILLAGILADQADAVAAVYAPWFDVAPCAAREGWVALAGRRRNHVYRLS
jgi:ribosomal protein L11 methyltransferase